jgi:transcriptional regulator with XRE-family HTH domain
MIPNMTSKTGFSEQLRQAIARSGLSQYRLAKLSGIDQSQLSRFMNGERGLSIEGIEKICELIGARLAIKAKPANPKRNTKGR